MPMILSGFRTQSRSEALPGGYERAAGKVFAGVHPDKTRLIAFGCFAAEQRARAGLGKPETFDFLGFTFISGKTREGKFLVKRKSRRDRAKAKLREIKDTLRRKMHLPIPEQGRWLGQVVTGYFAYHAVPNNLGTLVASTTTSHASGGARFGDAVRRTV